MFPNKYQKIIIGSSLIGVLLMGLFPPWQLINVKKNNPRKIGVGYHFFYSGNQILWEERKESHRFLFDSYQKSLKEGNISASDFIGKDLDQHSEIDNSIYFRIDFTLLSFQWLLIILLTTGLLLITNKTKDNKTPKKGSS